MLASGGSLHEKIGKMRAKCTLVKHQVRILLPRDSSELTIQVHSRDANNSRFHAISRQFVDRTSDKQ
ncbi:hypothetical protein C1850_10140 [Adlercreutzia equolifaciens subsp. celatus]|uniref:Uncharacterized protein n=1 Tax=Adlercreutzia equolifaciens subsp. celatus TaxID=394340 RepID=A0A369NZ39_9ACTN|nr:hypothetical protein C1850_10140 [Adlercreutzia equolifaciens subsp. celatus]